MFPRYDGHGPIGAFRELLQLQKWSGCLWILGIFIVFLFAGNIASAHARDNALMGFYQKHISAIDGNRCPMTPSCSEYAKQAVKKHGPILGWIMACDRLLRCGRSEQKIAPLIKTKDGLRHFDPLEHNDFWWFSSHEKHK